MTPKPVLIVGSGHLAFRVKRLAAERGHGIVHHLDLSLDGPTSEDSTVDIIARALSGIVFADLAAAFLVDEHDEKNLAVLIALISLDNSVPIVASLFNENVAPHLQAAHPHIQVLNPAKIAAPAFIEALDAPVTRALRYSPAKLVEEPPARGDHLIRRLMAGFGVVVVAATVFFHFAEHLSWLNAAYFVIVTVATVGYGDITLLNSPATTKLAGILLIVSSTVFIWMIFSLTVDVIIKRRVQFALGRRRYAYRDHVILCGLGRLGYWLAEGLLARGEKILIIERNPDASAIDHFRSRGVAVYVGDARLPRVLQDAGVTRAKALYSVINNDFVNLEIGLNARSFVPNLRLILRIFDDSMSRRISEHLDIHLTLSMTAIADEKFLNAASGGSR